MKTLMAWLGMADLKGPTDADRVGPIAGAMRQRRFGRARILAGHRDQPADAYVEWLSQRTGADVDLVRTDVTDPWDLRGIYAASSNAVASELSAGTTFDELTFHLSPGTGAMAATWIILSKTRYPAELIESSSYDEATEDFPVRTVSVPFDLSVRLIGDLLSGPAHRLQELAATLPQGQPGFQSLVYQSQAMGEVIARARRLALFADVPVLILGESGTGKELISRGIHQSSPRSDGPLVSVNCGAIPKDLIEAQLFGHVRGAFTGASRDHRGVFEQADGGTLFLDEVGELSPDAQTRFLRVLQEGELVRVGDHRQRSVNVRVIAATNRELSAPGFRLDLFHRLAVGVLRIPSLRQRPQDIEALIDHYLAFIPEQLGSDLIPSDRRLTPEARQRLLAHPWPGNVREIQATLTRAMIWSRSNPIDAGEIDAAIMTAHDEGTEHGPVLGRGFSLEAYLNEHKQTLIDRALTEAAGNKSRAASLLGVKRTTLAGWLSDRRL